MGNQESVAERGGVGPPPPPPPHQQIIAPAPSSTEENANDSKVSPEIEQAFIELLDELSIPPDKREQMLAWDVDRKTMLLASHSQKLQEEEKKRTVASESSLPSTPDEFFHALKHDPSDLNLITSLRAALSSSRLSWIQQFIDTGGMSILIQLLQYFSSKPSRNEAAAVTKEAETKEYEGKMEKELLLCVKAVMNTQVGIQLLLSNPSALNIIALSLHSHEHKTRVIACDILSGLCLIPPTGHRIVLRSMEYLHIVKHEPSRFYSLVQSINPDDTKHTKIEPNATPTTTETPSTDVNSVFISILDSMAPSGPLPLFADAEYVSACVTFINALTNTPGNVLQRIAIRTQLESLGIIGILHKLQRLHAVSDAHDSPEADVQRAIQSQISQFFELMEEDTAIHEHLIEGVDMSDPSQIVHAITLHLQLTEGLPMLAAILERLLLLSLTKSDHSGRTSWKMIHELIGQILIHGNAIEGEGDDLNTNPPSTVNWIDWLDIFSKYQLRENVLELEARTLELQESIEKIQRMQHVHLANSLHQDAGTSMSNPSTPEIQPIARSPLPDRFSAFHRAMDPSIALNEPSVSVEVSEPQQPSTDPDPVIDIVTDTDDTDDTNPDSMSPIALPPPPPPMMIKKPPAMPLPRSRSAAPSSGPRSPLPSVKMKTFQWKTIPHGKIGATHWAAPRESTDDVDAELVAMESLFCAFAPTVGSSEGSSAAAISRWKSASQLKLMTTTTLLDSKRSQNIGITLSRFTNKKMNHADIRDAILALDERKLDLEAVKALAANAVPTEDEIELLDGYMEDVNSLGKAEQFLFTLKEIPRLAGKLQCLIVKMSFAAMVGELLPPLTTISMASTRLRESKRFATMLQLILRIGNFMNGGTPRGGAAGFRLESLAEMFEVRSISDSKVTLVHYLVRLLENKFFKLEDLFAEIGAVGDAQKVSLQAITGDVAKMKTNLEVVATELKQHEIERIALPENDRFIPVMTEFQQKASSIMTELESKLVEANSKFKELQDHFGEDQDIFASVFKFKQILERVKQDIAKQDELKSRRNQRQIKSSSSAAVMDDLVAKLKAGDIRTIRNSVVLPTTDVVDNE